MAPAWRRKGSPIRRSVRRATRAVLHYVAVRGPALKSAQAEVTIVLTDDAQIRRLNRKYRGVDKATNVLSFGEDGGPRRHAPGAPILLGDVVLAYGTIAQEAAAQRKSLLDHASHLAVHGVLHLLGFDHQSSREATVMEAMETEILAGLGIADPYRLRRPVHRPIKRSRARR